MRPERTGVGQDKKIRANGSRQKNPRRSRGPIWPWSGPVRMDWRNHLSCKREYCRPAAGPAKRRPLRYLHQWNLIVSSNKRQHWWFESLEVRWHWRLVGLAKTLLKLNVPLKLSSALRSNCTSWACLYWKSMSTEKRRNRAVANILLVAVMQLWWQCRSDQMRAFQVSEQMNLYLGLEVRSHSCLFLSRYAANCTAAMCKLGCKNVET